MGQSLRQQARKQVREATVSRKRSWEEREARLVEAAVEVVAKGTLATAPAAAGSGGGTTTQSSDAAIWLGLIAIGIASCGFFLAGFLWTRRPMRLPGDPPDTPSDR